MTRFKLKGMGWVLLAAGGFLAAGRAQAQPSADLPDPAKVRQWAEQITSQPVAPGTNAIFYGDGMSHFDGLIPYISLLRTNNPAGRRCFKYTFLDGRVVRCELMDEAGGSSDYYAVWNSASTGAPVLSGYFRKDGTCDWWMYAEYGASGKVQGIYQFSKAFERGSYQTMSYEGAATRVKSFAPNGSLQNETLYENGEVFQIAKGQKRKINTLDREEEIRCLVRQGLKPLYPGY